MSLDDLTTLFADDPSARPPFNFRQGVVAAWDADTGLNSIDVGGQLLQDVPVMNTGEAIALKVGHVVGLLTWGHSWFIIGRITVPGSADFAAASVAFDAGGAEAFGFAVPTGGPNLIASSSELVVPDWADEALVHVTGNVSLENNAAGVRRVALQVGVNGGHGGGALQGFGPAGAADWQNLQQTSASSRNRFIGLAGGETLTLEASLWAPDGSLGAASGNNSLFMHAIAVFKSNV
jgi:hypothetical protein